MLEQREKIATNIRKGVLEYCVLGSLASEDKYGLELAEELTKLHLTAGEGSLYPLLARMKTARPAGKKVGQAGSENTIQSPTVDGSC